MPRTDTDETWRQLPDGTMELVSQTLRTVDDDEIAREAAPDQLRALLAKATWTAADLQAAVRAIIRLLLAPP